MSMLRNYRVILTWVLNIYSTHVLTTGDDAYNCAILEECSLVPRVSSSSAFYERVGFDLEFERLTSILKLDNPRNFDLVPENENLIKTKNIQTCLRIGQPIAWDDYQGIKDTVPGDKTFVMDGLLGKVDTLKPHATEPNQKSSVNMEACMFAHDIYFGGEQCTSKISTLSTAAGVGSTVYGDVSNKLIVPIIVSGYTKFVTLNEESASQTDFLCMATPLAKSLLNLETTTKQIYCSVESLMDILSPVNSSKNCASLNYRLSRTQLKGLKDWQSELPKTCKLFPSFDCKNSRKRASILGSIVSNTVGKTGSKLVTKVVDKLLKKAFKPPKTDVKGLKDEIKFKATLTTGKVLLAMRLENKFSSFYRQIKVYANKLQSWVRMMDLEARLTLQAFHEKYRLVLDKLTSDKLSCALDGDGVSFTCSRNALLGSGDWAQINLKTDKLNFAIGKVFFINCLEKKGKNFVGNRNVFLEFNQQFVNQNVSVPKLCLGQDTFDKEICSRFFTKDFIRNDKVADNVEIIAINSTTIQLSSDNEFSIATKNEKRHTPSKLFEVEGKQCPIIVSGAQGSAKITSKILNKIAYDSIQQRIMQAMPQLREFAMDLNKNKYQQLGLIDWDFVSPYHFTTIALGIMAVLWLIARLVGLCAGFRSRYKFKKTWKKRADSHETLGMADCRLPLMHQTHDFDRTKYREQLEKYVMSFSGDLDDPLTNGEGDPSNIKLLNLIQKSLDRAEQLMQGWYEDKSKTRKEMLFEVGYCLYDDLHRRMCMCAFPVHVCLNDVTLKGKWDGGRQMRKYLTNKLTKEVTDRDKKPDQPTQSRSDQKTTTQAQEV